MSPFFIKTKIRPKQKLQIQFYFNEMDSTTEESSLISILKYGGVIKKEVVKKKSFFNLFK
jgi:hypothetical protein